MRVTQICSVLLAVLLVKMASSHKHNAVSIINANNKFALTMYDMLMETGEYLTATTDLTQHREEFILHSPIGLYMALAMLQQGAEGRTLTTLSSVLDLPDKESSADGFERITRGLNNMENVTFEIANKLYILSNYTAKPAFKDVLQKFNTVIEDIDFRKNGAAATTINKWAEKKMHHKIKDLISSDDIAYDAKSIIVNTVYFKGDWLVKFDKSCTSNEQFHTEYNGVRTSANIDMMYLTNNIDYKYDTNLGVEIIRLPYANKDLSMVFILSNNDTSITDLEYKLSSYNLSTLTDDMVSTKIFLSMPKIKIKTRVDLTEFTIQAGLWNIFSKRADFSSFHDSPKQLTVTKIFQAAFIKFTEDGREEAPTYTSGEEEPKPFTLNRPFIFALQRKRNTLFYGKINNPFYNVFDL